MSIVFAILSKDEFPVGWGGFWPNVLSLLVLIEIRMRIKTRLWQLLHEISKVHQKWICCSCLRTKLCIYTRCWIERCCVKQSNEDAEVLSEFHGETLSEMNLVKVQMVRRKLPRWMKMLLMSMWRILIAFVKSFLRIRNPLPKSWGGSSIVEEN